MKKPPEVGFDGLSDVITFPNDIPSPHLLRIAEDKEFIISEDSCIVLDFSDSSKIFIGRRSKNSNEVSVYYTNPPQEEVFLWGENKGYKLERRNFWLAIFTKGSSPESGIIALRILEKNVNETVRARTEKIVFLKNSDTISIDREEINRAVLSELDVSALQQSALMSLKLGEPALITMSEVDSEKYIRLETARSGVCIANIVIEPGGPALCSQDFTKKITLQMGQNKIGRLHQEGFYEDRSGVSRDHMLVDIRKIPNGGWRITLKDWQGSRSNGTVYSIRPFRK